MITVHCCVGILEFLDDASLGDVSLDAKWIMVRGRHSALRVGSEKYPFSQRATITLHSRRYTAKEIPSYGAKNIAVRYGTLDLHGLPKTPTWTRLGATAEAGSITITLAESVNWQTGDKIAIASSVWGPEEVEDRFVSAVSADGVTLTLDRPLQFVHWGELMVCLLNEQYAPCCAFLFFTSHRAVHCKLQKGYVARNFTRCHRPCSLQVLVQVNFLVETCANYAGYCWKACGHACRGGLLDTERVGSRRCIISCGQVWRAHHAALPACWRPCHDYRAHLSH